ncbi:L-ribulose-5-phosphate 4-epimerase [Hydrogenispora ethanolica]|uniref:L-ribulose-5-phosphate 4-epimerase n=2 Tax=Hydrogenispora ethanolica TaxID=1082276 RepID=A0A4V2QGR9_HYDET|nr:L-ribulose-5-phosphate 4-epimerase [Hydrogenispora ethanolica]
MGLMSEKKQDLIVAAKRAYTRGIQTGSGGNISVRVPDHELMIVKPSGVSFIDCSEENLVVTDFRGNLVDGKYQPTREALLHGVLYQHLPEVGAVVHCHSPWSIGWSYSKRDLPALTYHAQLKFGCPVATLDIDAPVVPEEEMPRVLELFAKYPKLPAFLLVAHGVVALGKTAVDAEHVAEMVEETAQIAWLQQIGLKNGLIAG